MAGPTGLEPATSGVTGQRSNQLNYGPECLPSETLSIIVNFWTAIKYVRPGCDPRHRFDKIDEESLPEKLILPLGNAIISVMVTQTDFRVRYSETDGQRRAHHSHYPVWFEMGRADFCRQAGFDYKNLEDTGFYLVVARLECQYKAPLEYDDLVRIETRLESLSRKLMTFEYRVINISQKEALAGEGKTVLVCIDRQGRPASLPSDVTGRLQDCITPSGGKLHASIPGG